MGYYAGPLLLAVLLLSVVTLSLVDYAKGQFDGEKSLLTPQNSPYIKEFSVPWEKSGLMGIGVDAKGEVWFYMVNRSSMGRFTPSNGSFREYPLEGEAKVHRSIAFVAGGQFAFDESGRVWFTDALRNAIGLLDPSSGEVKMYPIPTSGSGPLGIVYDRRGFVWFAELFGNRIGRLEVEGKVVKEFLLSSERSGPALLFMDAEGKVWFTEAFGGGIGYVEPAMAEGNPSDAVREFNVKGLESPVGIVVRENVVWIADHGGSEIFTYFPSNGSLRLYTTSPAQGYPSSLPNQIALDGIGRVWFVEHIGNRIGVIDPEDGTMTEYAIPTGPLSISLWLAVSPTGEVWFTEWLSNKIGVLIPLDRSPMKINPSDYRLRMNAGDSKDVVVNLNFNVREISSIQLRVVESSKDERKGVYLDVEPQRIPATDRVYPARLLLRSDSSAEAGVRFISIQAVSDIITVSTMISVEISPKDSSSIILLSIFLFILPATALAFYLYLRRIGGRK